MAFDACEHRIRNIIIKAGVLLRESKGLPEENNVTVLYNETAPLLGITPVNLSSAVADHLPTPDESAKQDPNSAMTQICPKCGIKAYVLYGLCPSCKESEGGKFRSKFQCFNCNNQEKSDNPLTYWLNKFGIEFGSQSKASLGIKTITDDGIK